MNEEVKNDLENENAIEALRAEMMDFIPNWGPESDVRTIPEPKGDDQQCMILCLGNVLAQHCFDYGHDVRLSADDCS